jgi:hypothetical protein
MSKHAESQADYEPEENETDDETTLIEAGKRYGEAIQILAQN